jgi:hypothetical protein
MSATESIKHQQVCLRIALILLLINLLTEVIHPQTLSTGNSKLKLQGKANISTEFYTWDRDGTKPRESSIRAIIFSTVVISDKIKIPLSIYLTSQSESSQYTKHQQPFNQIGASPVFFRWLTVHGGCTGIVKCTVL